MPHPGIPAVWLTYLAATARAVQSHEHGYTLRRAHGVMPITPLYAHAALLIRVLHREAQSILVADQVMEADLDFAEAHNDFEYIEVLCGTFATTWPTPALGPAMAHHLRASLAAERQFGASLDDHLPMAATLFVEAQRHGESPGWLNHRWAHRRAVASARKLTAFLDRLEPPQAVPPSRRWRRSL